jgi:hypothetical protein
LQGLAGKVGIDRWQTPDKSAIVMFQPDTTRQNPTLFS